LQDPSEIKGGNLNNIKYEASRHFRNKKREYLEDRINELATNNKNNIIGTYIEEKINLKGVTNLEVTE
jgi:hypothetical protein